MQASSDLADRKIIIQSQTFPQERIEKILSVPGTYHKQGHFEYPLSEIGKTGNHLDALFLIEPIARHQELIDWIAEDIRIWMSAERIACDVIFAPEQPAVRAIVERMSAITGLPSAFWEYHPGGWFGETLVSGDVKPGSKALVFNAVSHTGRCIGERLPDFVGRCGGEAIGAASFALGTTDGAAAARDKFGRRLYSAVEVPLNLFSAAACPICASKDDPIAAQMKLSPWTSVRDRVLSGS